MLYLQQKEKIMEKYLSILRYSTLFWGIQEKDFMSLIHCLDGRLISYTKGEIIYHSGDVIQNVGVVLSGSICILEDDFWGNRTILGTAEPGELFGEVYACLQSEVIANNVMANEKTDVLFLDVKRVMTTCSASCNFHNRLIQNLLKVMAERNLMLTQKMRHMSKRTTRDKLLSYLSAQSEKQKSRSFQISLNRQQLADYLAVDRSAMSSALSKLRDEGVLEFHKNNFKLKEFVEEEVQ